jgi:ribonuclease T2
MKTHLPAAIRFAVALALLWPPPARAQQAGKFDYYLLSLSWSPEFCYSHQSSAECSQHLGLIVHGLWPQYNGANSGPENCANQPGPSNPDSLLDLLPTRDLISHEWATHGTCTGLRADAYFGLIRRIFSNFHAPPQLQHPNRQSIIRTADLKRAIAQSNPGLNDSEITLTCTGRYLREVQLCLTKDGRPQPCSGLRECRGTSVLVPPVR